MSYSYSRLIPSQLSGLKLQARISHLLMYMQENRTKRDWLDVLQYVLRYQQQSNQYLLQETVINRMLQDFHTFQLVIDSATELLDHAKSLRVFLFLLGNILNSSNYEFTYSIERKFADAAKKFGMLAKEIEDSDGKAPPELVVDAVKQGLEHIPLLLKRSKDCFDTNTLIQLIGWVNLFPVEKYADLEKVYNFCVVVVPALIEHRRNYTEAEREKAVADILSDIIVYCSRSYQGTENYFIVIDRIPDALSHNAVLKNKQRFLEFKEEGLLKCFNKLTLSCVSPRTLLFILHISDMLHREKDFFSLKSIYEQFILPKIILGPIKCSTVAQEEIRELTRFYVYGLQSHAALSREQLGEFVTQLSTHEDTFIDFWLKIAFLLAGSEQGRFLSESVARLRDRTKFGDYVTEAEIQQIKGMAWPIRAGMEQRRLYLARKTSLAGMGASDQHITTVMQMLFISRQFYELLKHHESDYTESSNALKAGGMTRNIVVRCKIAFELKQLFDRLKAHAANCTVNTIITFGPPEFKTSKEKDCAKYIECLLGMLAIEFEKLPQASLLNSFNKLFRVTSVNVVECAKCKIKSESLQNQYLFALPHGDFTTEWTEQLSFKCQKCQHENIRQPLKRFVDVFPEIFLCKIQRFSLEQGRVVKNLHPYSIPRRLHTHYLAGFICHVGTELTGNYTLFYRKEEYPLKWIKFEGDTIGEFETQNENQLIENSFAQDCTPYILIYQRYQRK